MQPTEIKLAENAKILIVEDDSDQRHLLVKIVQENLTVKYWKQKTAWKRS